MRRSLAAIKPWMILSVSIPVARPLIEKAELVSPALDNEDMANSLPAVRNVQEPTWISARQPNAPVLKLGSGGDLQCGADRRFGIFLPVSAGTRTDCRKRMKKTTKAAIL